MGIANSSCSVNARFWFLLPAQRSVCSGHDLSFYGGSQAEVLLGPRRGIYLRLQKHGWRYEKAPHSRCPRQLRIFAIGLWVNHRSHGISADPHHCHHRRRYSGEHDPQDEQSCPWEERVHHRTCYRRWHQTRLLENRQHWRNDGQRSSLEALSSGKVRFS